MIIFKVYVYIIYNYIYNIELIKIQLIIFFTLAYSKPFVLYVITNGNEFEEVENKGFSLTYRQIPCTV